jgi:hexosaminidase
MMAIPILFLFLFSFAAAIWPAPQSYAHGDNTVWIQKDIVATYNGQHVRWSSESFSSFHQSYSSSWAGQTERFLREQLGLGEGRYGNYKMEISSQTIVEGAVQRAFGTIFSEKLVPWKLLARNELPQFEPNGLSKKVYIKTLTITQTGKDKSSAFKALAGEVDESYDLKVTADGTATISAESYQGVLRALETFTQLFYSHSQGAGIYSNLIPLSITDSPKFSHRGLNLDVSRNWYPKSTILHVIDALAWNKFNRFHIHMTDGQSWPMEIPALPELSQKGAYQTGLKYSPLDIEEIQTYGLHRGVQVYIEIDMPGHTSAVALAYPDL